MKSYGKLNLILFFCILFSHTVVTAYGAGWLKTPQNKALEEEELLAIMEEKAGQQMENTIYVDMDHDGYYELIGVYSVFGLYQTWYCSSDGRKCCLVLENNRGMDYCNLEILEYDTETHVVINACCTMGTSKNYSILSLENGDISCLVSNHYGYVYRNDAGDIILDVEAYDGMYDPEIDGWIWHTWKDTYLYFDGKEYMEYGATVISEEEFSAYDNAQAILDAITSECTHADTIALEFFYYKRKNGIMQIQCNDYRSSGEIYYGYYTVRYCNKTLAEEPGTYERGQMLQSFSNLKVAY